jgi:glutaredoxin
VNCCTAADIETVSAPRSAGKIVSAGECALQIVRLLITCMLLAASTATAASEQGVRLYFFWRSGCPHCERESAFLERLRTESRGLDVRAIRIDGRRENTELFARVVEQFGIERPAVPLTVVGSRVFVGYRDDATSGAAIRAAVRECLAVDCPDVVEWHIVVPAAPARPPGMPDTLTVPFFGPVSISGLSLPALTVMLAAIDGFNPCAMWTLVFLIGLLVSMRDRWRMWTLGGAFIGASAAVYFLFMAAWLNVLLFLGVVTWIRVAVALVALAGGGYYLREFARNRAGVCPVTAEETRRNFMQRLRDAVVQHSFVFALAGIIVLAFAVNLIELICSAGIPAVYVQVLTLSNLPRAEYYAYLALYVAIFMLDDLLVFFAAMKTMQLAGLSGRYAHYSHLIGGVVLVAIGALLMFKPEWLAFG